MYIQLGCQYALHVCIAGEIKVRLFIFNFYICDAKNTTTYLVIYQIVFYTIMSINKLSLKYNLCEVVFTYFINQFHKTLFVFGFRKRF